MPLRRSLISLLIFLLAAVACSKPQKKAAIDQAKFEPLYRAAKAVQGSTSVGVNYLKFSELLQTFATELSIAKDKAQTANEKKLVEMYAGVLTDYSDSLSIWTAKNVAVSAKQIFGDLIPANAILDAAARQGLPVTDEEKTSLYTGPFKWKSIPANSIEIVWKSAGVKQSRANEFYYSVE